MPSDRTPQTGVLPEQIVPREDPEVAESLQKALESEGALGATTLEDSLTAIAERFAAR